MPTTSQKQTETHHFYNACTVCFCLLICHYGTITDTSDCQVNFKNPCLKLILNNNRNGREREAEKRPMVPGFRLKSSFSSTRLLILLITIRFREKKIERVLIWSNLKIYVSSLKIRFCSNENFYAPS